MIINYITRLLSDVTLLFDKLIHVLMNKYKFIVGKQVKYRIYKTKFY